MSEVKYSSGRQARKVPTQRSLDDLDRESFNPGPAPMDSKVTTVRLNSKQADHIEAQPVVSLDGIWLMAENGDEDSRLKTKWTDAIRATIPGSVHSALVAEGRLPDPTVGRNQTIVAQASYKTWWFQTTFQRVESRNKCAERPQ